MSGAMIAGGMGIASAGISASGGKGGEDAGAQGMYDPFAKERGKYVQQLSKFMSDPSYITQTESYKARMAAGRRGVESSGAAKGLLDSGAMGVELMQQGQTFASDEYDKEFNRLAQLAGVGFAPSAMSGGGGKLDPMGAMLGEASRLPWGQITGSQTPGTAPAVPAPGPGWAGMPSYG